MRNEKKNKSSGFKRQTASFRGYSSEPTQREDLELREEEYLDLEQYYANQASALGDLDDANAYRDFARDSRDWQTVPDFETKRNKRKRKKRKRKS